jgi:hypothetical protein
MRVLPLLLPAVLMFPALAAAQTMPSPPTVIGAHVHRGAHLHDGFYLRLATGVGSQRETIAMEGHDPGATIGGLSSAGELAVGYAVRPGFIVGLGSYTGTLVLSSESLDIHEAMPPAEILNDAKDFNVFGPFVDHYFDPRGGLHAQLALGIATVRGLGIADLQVDGDHVVLGVGGMLGFGYDWWISEEWSFGVLGRLLLAGSTGEDVGGVRWEHGVSVAPSLLFAATYN